MIAIKFEVKNGTLEKLEKVLLFWSVPEEQLGRAALQCDYRQLDIIDCNEQHRQ